MKRMHLSAIVLMVFAPISNLIAGTITQYTNRQTFTAAVGGTLTIEDFTNNTHFPITTGVLNSQTNLPAIGIFPGTIKPGVTYSTPVGTGNFFNIDAGGHYPTPFLDGFLPTDRDLTVTFDAPVTAFGFDTGGLLATSFDVTIHFVSGPDQTFNIPYPAQISFFGFQSSAKDIVSVVISNNNSSYGFDLDDFTFPSGPGGPVPTLTAIRPSSGTQGKTMYMRLEGTNFEIPGSTVQVSGTGVNVIKVNIDGKNTSTFLTAKLVIDPGAATGSRNVTVVTPSGGPSNSLPFTVNGPPAACPVSLPLSASGSRGNFTINAGFGTSRPIDGSWVTGWMVFGEDSITFQGVKLASGTMAANSPLARSLSINVAPLSAVAIVNAFYSPYLCGYSIATPNLAVPKAQIEAALNSIGLEDYNGSAVEIPR